MNINILSNHKCLLNLNVEGEYILTLNSVSGNYNPILLDVDDWMKLEGDIVIKPLERFVNISVHSLNDYFTSFGYGDLFTNSISCVTEFPKAVLDCSNRFKHIYDFKSFPTKESKALVQTNGPMVLIIHCEGIPTEMRFSNQTIGEQYSPIIANVVSINLNQFSVGFPFTLIGNSYKVNSAMMKNIHFKINDIYGDKVEFINDLIWS
jgi:hypothetical protein